MYQTVIQKGTPELERVIEFVKRELGKVRTGQASPSLVEDLMVDAYGQKTPLQQVAAISCPEPRQILIQPWDASITEAIQKAILQSSIGVSPVAEQRAIRIMLPSLTQEFRVKLGKIVAEKGEEAKRSIRHAREDMWNEIQEKVKNGEMREDDKFKGKEELQKVVDAYMQKVERAVEAKQKELEF